MNTKIIINGSKFCNGTIKWSHQSEALDIIQRSRQGGHKRGLLLMAPGVGKTFIGFEDALQHCAHYWEEGIDAKIFILVPTRHIRQQKHRALQSFYTAKNIKNLQKTHPELNILITTQDEFNDDALNNADVIISTYQFFNLHQREFENAELPIKYLLIDEAGHSSCPSYQRVINAFDADFTLGLSIEDIKFEGPRALQLLADNELLLPSNRIEDIRKNKLICLSDLYQGNVLVDYTSEIHIKEFIEKKYLSDVYVKTIDYEIKELRKIEEYITADQQDQRDFDTPKMYKDLNRGKLNEDIYKDYLEKVPKYKKEKPALCTCLSIDHANDLTNLFKEKRIKAEALHSDLSPNEQRDILTRFENGEILVLMIVNMLTQGYDFPEVETILQNRPIYSRHTYVNMVGRVWRYHNKKDYSLIVDRTWNFERYCSHNMYTVFNRQYQYISTQGEHFFSDYNKEYQDKKIINYNFRNFLPFIDKNIEYALTINQFREWRILYPQTTIEEIYKQLNCIANGQKKITYKGITFFRKDLLGITVWTIQIKDKKSLINRFNFQFRPTLVDRENDIILTFKRGQLPNNYPGLLTKMEKMRTKLIKESKITGKNEISKTQNGITLLFVKKWNNVSKLIWTIPKSDENRIVKFFGVKKLLDYDSQSDLALTKHNKVLTNKYQGIRAKIKRLIPKLNNISENISKNTIIKTQNDIKLTFIKKWNKNKPVWTINTIEEKELVKYFGLIQLPEFDSKKDIEISYGSIKMGNKYMSIRTFMLDLSRELTEESNQRNKNIIIKSQDNGLTVTFTKKWKKCGPVWIIDKSKEKDFIKLFKLSHKPKNKPLKSIIISANNNNLLNKYIDSRNSISELVIELRKVNEKTGKNEITKTNNSMTITFVRIWKNGKPIWTALLKNKKDLAIFLNLTELPKYNYDNDLVISRNNIDFVQNYPELEWSIRKLIRELNKEYTKEEKNIIIKSSNNITLSFIKKWKKYSSIWTIAKSKENILINYLYKNSLHVHTNNFDPNTDLAFREGNETLRKKYQGLGKAIKRFTVELTKESKENNQNILTKTKNGVTLRFEKKKISGNPIWTVPIKKEKELIVFFGLILLPIYNPKKDFTITKNKHTKYQGLLESMRRLVDELNYESKLKNKNILTKTKNNMTLTFVKKWNNTGPVWTISVSQKNKLFKYLNLIQLPLFNTDMDIAISVNNRKLESEPPKPGRLIRELALSLTEEESKFNNNIIIKTQNKITIKFIKKWRKNHPVWTISKSSKNNLFKFLGLK
ncbi:DEAD/DEAH box helicase family protein [bacterium]|nr:DEAD/DEAH box helicase family protein [bacterium]